MLKGDWLEQWGPYNTYSGMCTKVRKFKTAFRPVFHILHNHDRSRLVSFLKIMRCLYIISQMIRRPLLCVDKVGIKIGCFYDFSPVSVKERGKTVICAYKVRFVYIYKRYHPAYNKTIASA